MYPVSLGSQRGLLWIDRRRAEIFSYLRKAVKY